ncbi:hypothetical protein QYE76_046995 [Lolium multiflorum]|uniref:Uncharacterized protein n=1 Tax=Lolium multiflorum TaxID=4521 RepID=A0AAD8WYV6_LOLMU|nr:hypothetical protein QYE76_046995 [Lolium multiflorum]
MHGKGVFAVRHILGRTAKCSCTAKARTPYPLRARPDRTTPPPSSSLPRERRHLHRAHASAATAVRCPALRSPRAAHLCILPRRRPRLTSTAASRPAASPPHRRVAASSAAHPSLRRHASPPPPASLPTIPRPPSCRRSRLRRRRGPLAALPRAPSAPPWPAAGLLRLLSLAPALLLLPPFLDLLNLPPAPQPAPGPSRLNLPPPSRLDLPCSGTHRLNLPPARAASTYPAPAAAPSPGLLAPHLQDAETSEDPEENTKEYYEALFASQKPLHENTEVTQLDAIARLMALKCHRNLCRDGFDELLVIVGSLLPKGHLLPQNFYYSTKLLSDLKMSSQQIHACPKGCMLFREEHADTNYCIKCNSSRYFEVDRNGDGQKRQTTVAKNILRYLPVLPRIQRLFMNEDTAQQMRWAVEGNRYTDKMIHPSDGTAWKNFVKKFPLKAGDPRSVAVAISTDGFNPYGPKYPGKNMNVYLEPLVDDLVRGWEGRGIRTYDASKKEYFDMYVWYHTSLHDLPARALFCGWCTHGKWPCPQCRQAVTFFWLNKGGKYSCFDEARQFLERRHAYRSDVKSFKKGRVVRGPKPIPKTGTEIKAELDALQPSPDGNGFLGYGETHQWTHKPCLWKLPYFEFLELPHNIDVMHTEKNIPFGARLWTPRRRRIT